MKKIICCLLVILASSSFTFSFAQKKNAFEIKNGANISHWLSQGGNRRTLDAITEFFTRSDVEFIAKQGFDHIRIPIDEERMFDENGQKKPEAFALLHNALRWCDEFNLRAIVDLHILRSHRFVGDANVRPLFKDPKAQEQFYECWRKISGELNKYSVDKVAYEPMNEPVAEDHEIWNMILNRCVEVIRKLEPNRTILMGPNEWNSYRNAEKLKIPANDPNIIISFHYYIPMLLTHYQAGWTNVRDITVPVHYPGQLIADADIGSAQNHATAGKMVYNMAVIEKDFLQVVEVGKKHNLTIHCGEYGVISKAPEEDKIRWFKDLYTLFERHGIARSHWDYKSNDFGIITTEGVQQTKMINAILGKN